MIFIDLNSFYYDLRALIQGLRGANWEEKSCFPVKALLSICFVRKHFDNAWGDPFQLRPGCRQIILAVNRIQFLGIVFRVHYAESMSLGY